jgi:protein-S-isoprenylcysteine O-methyltransferase Ste14
MNNHQKLITPRVIVQILLFIAIIPFLPLFITRQWDWWEAWAYAFISIFAFVISRLLVARRNPGLVTERAHSMQHENVVEWDKKLAPYLGVGSILVLLVSGLDALFSWSSTYPMGVIIISVIAILAGYALGSFALIENRFFSGAVRIQTERGHQVVSSGPYRWIRHPGYAGAILTYLATPFFLDSPWAFLPTLFVVILMLIRTRLEDKFLQDGLDGYRDYSKHVRYRILPGLW